MASAQSVMKGRVSALAAVAMLTVMSGPLFSADQRPDYKPAAYAIVGARIVAKAGHVIEKGTVIVRRGVIESIGASDQLAVPPDAESIDAKGMVVYPGFLDLYTTLGVSATATKSLTGPGRAVPYNEFALASTPPDNRSGLTPEFEVASALELPETTAEERRKLGFTSLLAAPGGAIATGQSALVSLGGLPRRESVVRSPIALHIALRTPFELTPPVPNDNPATPRRRQQGQTINYPTALMGVVAHLRQAMLDAQFNHEALGYYDKLGGPRPPFDPSLEALYDARSGKFPVWWEANTRDEIHRALDLAAEFGVKPVIVGGREAEKVADRLKAEGVPVVLRVDFPEMPRVPSESDFAKRDATERQTPLRVLADREARWKERVGAAGVLSKAGVRIALSSDGISKAETFHAQVRKMIAQGLSEDSAVDALTRQAAEIAGVGNRLGTIESGKLGHLVVMTGPYKDDRSRPRYLLVDGLKFDLDKATAAASKNFGEGKKGFGGGVGKARTKGDRPSGAPGREDQPGEAEKHATPKETAKEKKPEAGTDAPKSKDAPAPKTQSAPTEEPAPNSKNDADPQDRAKTKDEPKPNAQDEANKQSGPFVDVASELDSDRKPTIKTGGNALLKNATILTGTRAGTVPKGSILIRNGKIDRIGADLDAPAGFTVIDCDGLVAMPGIIDAHSHIAIQGGVNEGSLSIVPEVRVSDVIDSSDISIYRGLAGGLTAARLLHGSANTIGGQDAIIKLKYGEAARDLLLKDPKRPQGVKFALGENVTRRTGRFPNTRMGVEATIERAFEEAKAYATARAAHESAKAKGQPVPPFRKDLRLEAIAGILDGSIKIHSHCYRQDEILMLLRVAERHGVRVRSLQHALEGYKVAPEIAAHGASTSTFSDWWAYKVEAFDAIPFNAALLTEAGVSVCIKSDSEELHRHLYLEAAKMIKYGGVSEQQALAMITLNPARELGLDHRMGSIELGKDADIAVFNGHPFDAFSRCELVLIDGEVRFQRFPKDGKPQPGPGAAHLAETPTKGRALEINENPKGTYALVGATLHPVSAAEIKNGVLIVAEGKIAALGGPELVVPEGMPSVDVKGLDIWPGMIDSGSIVGLFEVGSLPETQDHADSAPFQPELRTSTALHPDSELIPVTRANGVLASLVQPTGGTISGQACIAELNGWVPSEMVLADRVGLVVVIPTFIARNPEGGGGRRFGGASPDGGEDPNSRRKERLDAIKEQFEKALAYDKIVAASKTGQISAPEPDPRLTALLPYAKGEKLVIFRADRPIEILDAIKLAKDLKLKAVISGAAEGWKVAAELKASGIPVLVSGTHRNPLGAADPYDAPYANPAKLHAAGVTIAIRSIGQGPDQATSARNLPYEAATAVAFGLPEAEAIKAVTINPARILGIDDKVGSLESGKRANLVITAGHLLQAATEVKYLFVGGKPLAPESRHTRLYAKYRQRLADVKAGIAPLGLERDGSSNGSPTPSAPPAPVGGSERR